MNKRMWLSCALALMLPAAWAAAETSQKVNPRRLAKACIANVTRTANHCVAANAKDATRTVHAVNALQRAGKDKLAERTAKRGIERVGRRSAKAARTIAKRCTRCAATLVKLGHKALGRAVKAAGEKQVRKVSRSRRAAVAKIRRALGDE